MAIELCRLLKRPEYAVISKEIESEESTYFRSKFFGWDDIVPFDFTRTADSIQKRGADIKVIMERDKVKTDLVALFLDRLPSMSHEDADQMIEECNGDLEVIEPFVLVNYFLFFFFFFLTKIFKGRKKIYSFTKRRFWHFLYNGLLCVFVSLLCCK